MQWTFSRRQRSGNRFRQIMNQNALTIWGEGIVLVILPLFLISWL